MLDLWLNPRSLTNGCTSKPAPIPWLSNEEAQYICRVASGALGSVCSGLIRSMHLLEAERVGRCFSVVGGDEGIGCCCAQALSKGQPPVQLHVDELIRVSTLSRSRYVDQRESELAFHTALTVWNRADIEGIPTARTRQLIVLAGEIGSEGMIHEDELILVPSMREIWLH